MRSSTRMAHDTMLILGLSLALAAPVMAASLPGSEQRVTPANGDPLDWFGRDVDVFGDFAVIGAPGDDDLANGAGAAYVLVRQGTSWVEFQKLTAEADAAQFDAFGTAVAIERDLIAVGAPGDDDAGNDAGAVYVFQWDGATWSRVALFEPNDPANHAYEYGIAVDIGIAVPESGTQDELVEVLAGAPGADQGQGVVFLSQRSGGVWTMNQGRFSDSDSQPGLGTAGQFGSSVAISGDNLIGGAPTDDQNAQSNRGAAYIFGRDGILNPWTESAALYPTAPLPAGGRFGLSVAIDDNVAVVGAPSPGGGGGPDGRVSVYGPVDQTFDIGDPLIEFGSAVAVDESMGLIVIGAKRDDEIAAKAGAVYLLEPDGLGGWMAGGKVLASDAAINKEFGESVAMQGGTVIIGGGEIDANSPGAAYIYSSRLFADGFESGDTLAWSSSAP